MAAFMPRELREQLARLVREKPHATQGQIVKIFLSRTGHEITYQSARYARRKWSGGANWSYHLSSEHRATIKELIALAAPLYCWEEIALDFERIAGRSVSAKAVANVAYREMGVKPIGNSIGSTGGIGDRNTQRAVEVASADKLSKAPYRPGYFPKSYRGPEGGDGGDRVRVYRTGGPSKDAG